MNPDDFYKRKSVFKILQDNKMITKEQEILLLSENNKSNKPMQSLVAEMGFVTRVEMLRYLSSEWQIKAVNLDEIDINPETVKLIPEEFARNHHVMPIVRYTDNGIDTLSVVITDPKSISFIPYFPLRLNCKVLYYLALPEDIIRVLDNIYTYRL